MEKRIAVLEVVLDSNCPVSRLESFADGHFILRVCPSGDESILLRTGKQHTKQDHVSIFAHELGHFVAHLFGFDGAQEMSNLQTEKQAWDLAETIVPGAKDSLAFQHSVQSYTALESEAL